MIDTWIFDLDNTLYHPNLKIIENAREHYIRFVEERLGCSREEAMYLDRMFHGNHDRAVFDFLDKYQITPKELYEAIRGIEVDHVPENPALRKQLDELPGRKFIFTNAPDFHAEKLLKKLGLDDLFDGVYDIGDAKYITKPNDATYDNFIKTYNVDPKSSIMFEDSIKNLKPAHDRGMTTVYVDYHLNEKQEKPNEPYVHYITDCLMTFLTEYPKGVAA